MISNFKALTLNYKDSPLQIREKLSLSEEEVKALLQQFHNKLGIDEALVLSTCNRTEVYYASDTKLDHEIIPLLAYTKSFDDDALSGYFELIDEHHEAVKHLFEVAVGLESQVLGDLQITNQVKNAYQWTADLGMAGPFLHRLLHTIFYTNKRIVQETAFRDGAASVSYAAKELIEDLVHDPEQINILSVGLGEIGRDVINNLIQGDFKKLTIANRTYDKAADFAGTLPAELNIETTSLNKLTDKIDDADVIITAINTDEVLLDKSHLEKLNIHTHKFFIDLSVPRSIEKNIEELPGIILYNIDDINNKTSEALKRRYAAIPKVKEIVRESIEGFYEWSKEMEVSPTINKIKHALEQIRQEEISRYNKALDQANNELVDNITKSMMQKILKLPVLQLKAACKRGEADTLVDALNDVFDLERNVGKNSKEIEKSDKK